MLMLAGRKPPLLPASARLGLPDGDPPGEAEAEERALELPFAAAAPPCRAEPASPSPPSELARVRPRDTIGAAPAASAAHALSKLPLLLPLLLPFPGV